MHTTEGKEEVLPALTDTIIDIIDNLKQLTPTRRNVIAIRKLQEAFLWLNSNIK